MTIKSWNLQLGAIAAAALMLTACSGTQTTEAPSTPASSTEAASATATPTAEASSSTEASPSADAAACETLPEDPLWYGDNHKKLVAMIEKVGTCGGSNDVKEGAPLALFDWDNTVVKNDIGDATTYWMLANGKVLQPADWAKVSTWITEDAAKALTDACGSLAEVGKPLPTNEASGAKCADEILSVYGDGETTTEKEAFKGYNARRVEPQYAFAAQLHAGYTEKEIQEFATLAREANLKAAEGTEDKVGTEEVTGWVRYYDQITDLIKALQANGFDVRIVSASAEPVVRAWAEPLGLTGDKVLGVTMVKDGDKLTAKLEGCGGDDEAMTYIEGKRCRVNELIYGITGEKAFETAPEGQRPVFGAGDSDTDISFMIDATEARLAINRNKTELMCHAYDNEDGKWLINPMFIEPKDKKDEAYKCSTNGEILPDGGTGPLKDIAGNLIEDQEDTVFGMD